MAASMAGILLQAGDTRWVGHQAWVMIHRAAFGAWGKTHEIEDEVEFVKELKNGAWIYLLAVQALLKLK